MHAFLCLLDEEWRTTLRHPQQPLLMLGFGLMAISLMSIVTDAQYLPKIAAGTVWIIVLFSLLLSLESVFSLDHRSGRLELLLCQPIPRWLIVLAKAAGLWIRAGLPLIITAPLAGVFLQLPLSTIPHVMLGLLLGTPSLCLLACVGASLTLGARSPTLLIMVIILPLFIPVLIFGALGLERTLLGYSATGSLLWLGVCFCFSLLCLPLSSVALQRPL